MSEQMTDTELPPQRVAQLRESGEAELIDVRVDEEWEAGHIPGSRQIEVNELTASAASIPRDRTVVFVCRTGNRSGMAAQAFAEAGYHAHNLAGGIAAWAEASLPLEPEDGTVAERRPPEA